MTQQELSEKAYGGPVPDEAERRRRQSAASYMDTRNAADYLGVSHQFLEKLRHFGGGPEFIRVTSRCIRYSVGALDAWMADRTATSTSDYQGGEAA